MLERETLTAVLQFTGCTELPAALKEGDIYVRAIAKVKKANNHETMCVIVNDGEGNPIIKKDFGSISMIKEIVEIYPLSVLESSSIPDFRKKKDIVDFLVSLGETESNIQQLAASKADEDKATLKALIYKHCIKLQARRESSKPVSIARKAEPVVEPEQHESTAPKNNEQTNTENNGTDTNNTVEKETTGEDKATDSDF